MKKLAFGCVLSCALLSCSDANDGNANTDTTVLPVDTNEMKSGTDTTSHINTNTGTYPTDTTQAKKADVRSSTSAYPDGSGKDSMQ